MAFIDSGTWDGKYDSSQIYSDCIFGAPTLEKGGVKFLTTVKKSVKIPIMNMSSVLQSDACVWNPQGDLTLTDKEVTVCKMRFNVEFCIQDLETSYSSEQMQAGAMNSDFPASPLDYVLSLITKTVRKDYELLLWQGDTTSLNPTLALCDGILKIAAADPNIVTVAGTTLTAANIVAELTKVYDAIDDCIMDDPELRLYMPIGTKKMLRQAIAASPSQVNNLGIGLVGNDDFDFFGIPIIFTHGIPADTIYASVIWNNWVGCDLVQDIDEIKVLNFSNTKGDDVIACKGRFFSGVQVYNGMYSVLYS